MVPHTQKARGWVEQSEFSRLSDPGQHAGICSQDLGIGHGAGAKEQDANGWRGSEYSLERWTLGVTQCVPQSISLSRAP